METSLWTCYLPSPMPCTTFKLMWNVLDRIVAHSITSFLNKIFFSTLTSSVSPLSLLATSLQSLFISLFTFTLIHTHLQLNFMLGSIYEMECIFFFWDWIMLLNTMYLRSVHLFYTFIFLYNRIDPKSTWDCHLDSSDPHQAIRSRDRGHHRISSGKWFLRLESQMSR